jgi:N,N'-diacetyllegionaminate synthase
MMTNKRKKMILAGGGGHGKVVINAVRLGCEYEIIGIVDQIPAGNKIEDIPVLGNDDKLHSIFDQGVRHAFIGVGSVGDYTIRERIFKLLKEIGYELPVIVHPDAVVAESVIMGEGTFVAAGAIINPGVRLGRNVIINTRASVDHDCSIGDFVHIAPGAVLSGQVTIGPGTHVGTGANVIQGISIGRDSMIGAGCTVLKNISDEQLYINKVGFVDFMKTLPQRNVYIIAEAGVNHNGDIETAKNLIKAAKEAGADAVKFQTFKAEDLATRNTPSAEYQTLESNNSNQFEMLKALELDEADHHILIEHSKIMGIDFLSSPFGVKEIDFLATIGVSTFKVPSSEINNLPYLRKLCGFKKKVILSTGMCELNEVKAAVEELIRNGMEKKDIAILHCNTAYPTPPEDVNLLAMLTMRDAFTVTVGYSDHTDGITAAVAAAALGAEIIEKHFTLDRSMPGPDHKASLEPHEFGAMVKAIRDLNKMMGDGVKKMTPSEAKNVHVARKSIVAARTIAKGEVFSEENITVKRPGTGINPMCWDDVIGQKSPRDFEADEIIEL